MGVDVVVPYKYILYCNILMDYHKLQVAEANKLALTETNYCGGRLLANSKNIILFERLSRFPPVI